MVVGSIARNTNLKGDADIDIFMLFDKSYKKERLSSIGMEYGKRLVDKEDGERYEIKYAEHPYIRAYLKTGLRADIVPASKIESTENLATAVDRTPLHTEFINSSMSERQRDDVRLLKFFLKTHGIYGAEIRIGGFSGYLCELLILQFGSLLKLFEGMAKLRLPVILEPKNRKAAVDDGIIKKFGKRFVVIDPVDPNRNVAAAVSEESLAKLALIAREFDAKPDVSLFYGEGFSSTKTSQFLEKFIKESGLDFFLMALEIPDKTSDVVWPQLRKMSLLVVDYMKRQGFDAYLNLQWMDEKRGFVLIAAPKLKLTTRLMKGPDVFKTTDTASFMKRHGESLGFVLNESVLYTLEKSKYSEAVDVMKELVKGKIIKKHKDINFNGAELFLNEIPKKYSEAAYLEIRKATSL
jgi:tRNA nucleotidyltransferase (CCA-adding enzyme)